MVMDEVNKNKEKMVSKEDYKKALSVVEAYNEQLNEGIVTERICCACKKNVITPIDPNTTHPLKQEQGMWANGVVEKITFGYGSKYDMESFYIAICDECVEELETFEFATNLNEIKQKLTIKS